MSVSTDTERIFRIGGYVKRAKLNLRNEREIRAFHRNAIERRFGDFEDGTLVDVYIDITGYKETAKRPEMLRLMRDCADGKVNLIFAETKGYLSANTREFCYWLHFIFNLKERVDIITDDDKFNINTILNADKQREALIKMAEDYIYLNPPDHQKWLNGVVSAITVPFPVSWTVKMKKKQKETQDILSYHTQAAGCSDKARAKASGGRQPIEECGRTGL